MTRAFRTGRAVLLAIGLSVSAYLTYVHFADVRIACPTSGCERVQQSFYSTPHGLPLPLLGLLLFGALAVLAAARGARMRTVEAGSAMGGGAAAVYLIGVQVVSLGAVCLWCVAADASLVGLAALAAVRLVRELAPA